MVKSDYIFKNRCYFMFTFKKQLRSRLRYAFKESYIVDGAAAVDVLNKQHYALNICEVFHYNQF